LFARRRIRLLSRIASAGPGVLRALGDCIDRQDNILKLSELEVALGVLEGFGLTSLHPQHLNTLIVSKAAPCKKIEKSVVYISVKENNGTYMVIVTCLMNEQLEA
jgi:hypothetical protein